MMRGPYKDSAVALQCVLSPLRLYSAAAWHLIQKEAVSHYDMLEEFVSVITDSLPDLLSYRQKTQLSVGLRAKFVLDLCSMESLADPDTVQSNLQRIETLVALHKELESGDALVEESGANFLALVQILLKDPDERSIFFKDVYPLYYGEKFNLAIRKLMWLFLSRLENTLPQPTLEEVAHMLSTAPTVMEECVRSLSKPQQIQHVLQYQKDNIKKEEKTQLWSTSPDDCILSCLSSPQIGQMNFKEQTSLDTQSDSELDCIPSYCQEVQVESVVITQYELQATESQETDKSKQFDAQEEPINTQHLTSVAYKKVESVDLYNLDESSENQVATNEANDDGEEVVTPQNEQTTTRNQKEALEVLSVSMIKQSFVKLDRLDVPAASFSNTFNPGSRKRGRGRPKKHPENMSLCMKLQKGKNITMPRGSITKPAGLKNGVSGVVPMLKKKLKGTSGKYACSLCSFQDDVEIHLHHHLIVHHPEEYERLCVDEEEQKSQDVVSSPCVSEDQNSPVTKVRSYRGVPVCKTCPTCGKTFSRSTDMRRHQVAHTMDRPFVCPNCGKSFRYTFDLKRHRQRVCAHKDYVVVSRGKSDVPEETEGAVRQELHISSHYQPVTSPGSGTQSNVSMCLEELAAKVVSEPTHGSSLIQVNRHSRSRSLSHLHPCSQCGKAFKYFHNLKKHEDVCEGKSECTYSDRRSDPSGPSTDVRLDPSFQKPCVDEEEQQRNVARAKKSDSSMTCCRKSEVSDTLAKHGQTCASSKRCFKCVKCDALFDTVLDVQNHVHVHWAEDPLQCSRCGKSCLSQSELAKHTLTHENESKQPCTLCSDTFNCLDSLREHYVKAHDFKGPYQCSMCDKTDPDLKALVKHVRTHSEMRPYQCSHCSKSFRQRSALTVHAKIHSGDRPFLCDECGKCFRSNVNLQSHLMSHRTEKPYACSQCKNRFKSRYALHSHSLKHTTGASVPCEICGKMFFQASALHRHHRTHTGERPYSCSKCGKTFLTQGEVTKHMRYHTGERPFGCTLCSKTFTQACYLSVHMRIHTGERPYQCSVCKRAFVCNTHLKRHMFVHTQERPFKCVCGKAFNQAHPLKVHQRTRCLLSKK